MDEQIYYGFIQMNHGADHVFLYTREQILKEFAHYGIDPDVLPVDEEIAELDLFPIGGSNSAASRIWKLEGDEMAKDFICQVADGPDYENPPLVSLAEYYYDLDTNEGCMKEFLDKFDIDKETQEKKAMKAIEDDTAMVCKTLGISFKDFYEDEYAYVRMSEVYFLSKIKELIRSAEEKGELVWSNNTDEPEIRLKLDEDTAKEILIHNSFNVWGKDKNMIDETYLVIEKEPDGEIVYDFIEYAGGNTLEIPYDESEDLMKKVIQKMVEEKTMEAEKTQRNPEEDAKLIFMDLQKKAHELEVTSTDGKYFGYDIADIQSALTSVEGLWKLLNNMYSVDQMFGCDPMYYGLSNTFELEAYLRREHYLPDIHNELSFEVTLFMDAKDALVSAMKGTLDLQSEVMSQLTSGNADYDCLCDELNKELFNNNMQVNELLNGADLKEYVQVDLNSLEMDYDKIDPLDDYSTLPVCLSCKFNLERFRYDYTAELLDLRLTCLDHARNDDMERD